MKTFLLLMGGFLVLLFAWGIISVFRDSLKKDPNFKGSKSMKHYIWAIVISLVIGVSLMIFAYGTTLGTSSGPSLDQNTCRVCGRSWHAGDSGGNYMSIARTHMCVNCYNNYKYAEQTLDK